MGLAWRVAALGRNLRVMAQEISGDFNETYYLAHEALRRILNNDPGLSQGEPSSEEMRSALLAADLARRIAIASTTPPERKSLMFEAAA